MKDKIIKRLVRYLPRHIAELLADEILALVSKDEPVVRDATKEEISLLFTGKPETDNEIANKHGLKICPHCEYTIGEFDPIEIALRVWEKYQEYLAKQYSVLDNLQRVDAKDVLPNPKFTSPEIEQTLSFPSWLTQQKEGNG